MYVGIICVDIACYNGHLACQTKEHLWITECKDYLLVMFVLSPTCTNVDNWCRTTENSSVKALLSIYLVIEMNLQWVVINVTEYVRKYYELSLFLIYFDSTFKKKYY